MTVTPVEREIVIDSDIDEAIDLLVVHAEKITPELRERFLRSLDDGPDISIRYGQSAAGTEQVIGTIRLPQSCRELLTALATGELDRM